MDQQTTKNLAETLADVLPKAALVQDTPTGVPGLTISQIAVPKGSELKEVRIDLEKFMPAPRATKAKATFATVESFLAYIHRHATNSSLVWCDFNPQTFSLAFTAVLDEHDKDAPAWRTHTAHLTPEHSAEWKAWKAHDGKPLAQIDFAQWIQNHDEDIATAQGLPTALQMLEMAQNFIMNEERQLKSSVRLQSGGMRLTYIADPDQGTVEAMQMFERFGLGIPVFHGGPAWSLGARLKYRNTSGKLSFSYELIRADRVHEGAAKELITQVRDGLGTVPMLMGSCA